MKTNLKLFTALAIVLAVVISGCSNTSGEKKEKSTESHESSEMGEHARDVGEGGEGEEDGTQFSKSDVYDVVKKGTHLILKYEKSSNAFVGTVENNSDDLIERVRIEVHLSNGLELGPTTPMDLKPGAIIDIKLDAGEKDFETWSTHAEVGNSEHSHEGGEGGEHK
ncbi:MAG: hypothetical protein QNK33_04530 [Bacteroidales bacterium]|nr:hypothetical protein [Bacteroidales bacterium]